MNAPLAATEKYIDFLIASPAVFTTTEAARVQPLDPRAPAHDAFTRRLNRLEPAPDVLWHEVAPQVKLDEGALVLDDSPLDKPCARHMGLVGNHWSGKHKRVMRGINLLTLLWTDGDSQWPCDYRLTNPTDRLTKNDHLRALLAAAHERKFAPRCIRFDSWYSSLENLKAVDRYGWKFLTQLKWNRLVDVGKTGYQPVSEQPISAAGTEVHLKGFGTVKVFRVVATNGHTEHWVTNDLSMDEVKRLVLAELAWGVEEYNRGLKQSTGVERCQLRQRRAQRNHIGCAIRAFVRLEYHRWTHGDSWFEAKMGIILAAVRAYLTNPRYRLPSTATA